MKKKLLALFAHPDDESFGTGATMAYYAGNGVQVDLVCATNGDVGEIAAGLDATPETLWQVRQNELRCAAGNLGVSDLIFLNYRDSGMAGTEQNHDPRAFVNVADEEVEKRLVGIIRRLQPQVVITFDPTGAYGHPDHVAIHRHAVAAFHAAGDPSRFPEQGEAWHPSRLFYMTIPRTYWERLRSELEAVGEEVGDWDNGDERDAGWPDDCVTVSMVLPQTVDAKIAALACHASQFGEDNMFRKLPPAVMRDLLCREFFAMAWPAPDDGQVLADLFAGLDAG